MAESRLDRIKGIARALIGRPYGPGIKAEMEERKKKLEKLGPKKTGGMFDVIYKGRKAREDAMQDYLE